MLTVLNNLLSRIVCGVSSAAAVISPGDSTISARSCTRTSDVCLRYLLSPRGQAKGRVKTRRGATIRIIVIIIVLLRFHRPVVVFTRDSIVIVLKHFICLLLGTRCLFYVVTNVALVRPNVRASYRYAPRRKTFSRPKVRKTIIQIGVPGYKTYRDVASDPASRLDCQNQSS